MEYRLSVKNITNGKEYCTTKLYGYVDDYEFDKLSSVQYLYRSKILERNGIDNYTILNDTSSYSVITINYKEMTAFATYYAMDLAKHCGCDCAQIWLCILIDEGIFSFKESEYENDMYILEWYNYGN